MSLQVRPSPSTYLTFQDWNSFQWISEFSFNTDIYSINQNYNPTALQCVILKIIFVPCWESPATYVSPLSYSDFSFTFTCLYLQDFNSSAIYWPLGGVLSLTLKYLVYLVCVCARTVPGRWWSKDRYCGFCTGGAGSGHPASDPGTQTWEILPSTL